MGSYHNKLDRKYFNKSVYVKKFEEVFNVKIKDYPKQYEMLLDTFNTLISFNNILFTKNYIKKSDMLNNSIYLLTSYLNKYKNKINKCYDLNCISIYEGIEEYLDELKEMQSSNININFEGIKKDITKYVHALDILNFDEIYDSKKLPYAKQPNDKLPKKIACKLVNNLEKIKSPIWSHDELLKYNDSFIKYYFDKTGIDLNKDKKTKDLIFDIHINICNINNAIIDKKMFNDDGVFHFYMTTFDVFCSQDIEFLKDIYYKNLYKRVKAIIKLLEDNNVDLAYKNILEIINQYSYLYERIS